MLFGVTCALWVLVACVWAYRYVTNALAAPGVVGYETQWDVQLFFFAITRLPGLLVILAAALWLEWKFLPSASRVAQTNGESTNSSPRKSKQDRPAVRLLIRMIGFLYGVVGVSLATILFSFLSAQGVSYPMQIQYFGIGAAISILTMYGFLTLRSWGRLLAIVVNALYVLVFLLALAQRPPAVVEVLLALGAAAVIGFCLMGSVMSAMRR
jgi:hypothetical protein